MSPRRMDISSLLRDPTPPPDESNPPLPASLLSILNSPRAVPQHHRHPFLALDALVHVASEERRRITAYSDQPSLLHHDRPPRPDPPSFFHDNSRPHKRTRYACPPSPSEPGLPLLPGQPTSPNIHHHPSASPSDSYPTLRRQPMEPTAPLLLSPQQLAHSSPRNNSPHRHSPQHLWSQHHSSPVISTSTEVDAMSPRCGHGPKMAGGIEILSNDPSPRRDTPRPSFSIYHSPGRDLSTERYISDSHAEHARHTPGLSPLSAHSFPLDDVRHQPTSPSHLVDSQVSVPREPVRSHFSLVDAMADITKSVAMPARELGFSAQHVPERHPIRVWEEQPTTRDASRRVSPTRVPGIVSDLAKGRTWSPASESGHGERPVKEDRATALRQDVVENVFPPPFFNEYPSYRHPTSEPLAGLQMSTAGTRLDARPSLPMPLQPESPTYPLQTSRPSSSTPPPSASPVLDFHLKNLETQLERPERYGMQVDGTSVPLSPSDPIVAEPVLDEAGLMPGPVDADASFVANSHPRQPSPRQSQPALALDQVELGSSTCLTHANVSQSTSRSLSQQPDLSPTKGERSSPPINILISPPIQSEPASRQSLESDHISEGEQLALEQAMTDVDEELLSLVEDRPAPARPAVSKAQSSSRSPLPIMAGHATTEQGSGEAPDGSPLVLPSQPVHKGPFIADEEKDRASMPPPAARNKKAEKDKITLAAGTATGSKKKKDAASRPTAKPKPPPKPRAKAIPKAKTKANTVDPSSKVGVPKGVVNINVRSRSTSVIPGPVDEIVPEPEAGDSDKEDGKLYCVCKTRYDEDRMMIACDRCDEWFHTLCVDMPDLEIDLVDQFICPPCIQKHPQLRTTWKRRCLFGLQHENPSSPEACHKPSRGAFSKYCSDDCGIKYMRTRIAQWEKSGGVRDLLWEGVKNAPKREGVVVCAVTNGSGHRELDVDNNDLKPRPLDSAAKRRAEREVARLNTHLEKVVKEREFMKRELDMVLWREKVVELASERARKVDECGWDQRLCFGEEEWADFGEEVLESYEEERVKVESGDDATSLDNIPAMHGEWWCTGKKKCERHAGWQKLRAAEVLFDKETKEGILLKLTTREREIRKCIEDILYPQPTGTLQVSPLDVQLNGSEKPRVSERGKRTL